MILSDGVHYQQAMLATQQNHLVEAGQIDKNAIVVVKQYAMNEVQGRRIVICLDVDPQGIADDKIGTPGPVEPTGGAAAAAAAPAAASASAAGKPAASKAAPAKRNNASRGGPSGAQAPIYPIEGLSPYQNKWTIKARVTQKSDIRTWTNQKGEGKLFSVTLMDETGEIRATGFNNAVDNLYELLEENKVYFISKARVNIAKKQFNNVNNEYEITFDDHSEVELVRRDAARDRADSIQCTDTDVPQVKYNFVELASLDSVEKDQTCDVLAVVKEVGDVSSITAKASGRSVSKRELTLVDRSSFSVRLTLWGKQAESWNIENEPVVAFKAVKVGDFGGRSLSMVGSSSMLTNPDIAEAHDLRGWYDNQGATTTFTAHSRGGGGAGGGAGAFKPEETRTIQGVRDAQLGMNESSGQADFFNMRATVIFIKSDSLSYPACKSDSCNKKVTEDGSGGWRCEKCDKSHDAPEYRCATTEAARSRRSSLAATSPASTWPTGRASSG